MVDQGPHHRRYSSHHALFVADDPLDSFGDLDCTYLAFKKPLERIEPSSLAIKRREDARGCLSPCGNMFLAAITTLFRRPNAVEGEPREGPHHTGNVQERTQSRVNSGNHDDARSSTLYLKHFLNKQSWGMLKEAFVGAVKQNMRDSVQILLDGIDNPLDKEVVMQKGRLGDLPDDVMQWFYVIVERKHVRFQMRLRPYLFKYKLSRDQDSGNLVIEGRREDLRTKKKTVEITVDPNGQRTEDSCTQGQILPMEGGETVADPHMNLCNKNVFKDAVKEIYHELRLLDEESPRTSFERLTILSRSTGRLLGTKTNGFPDLGDPYERILGLVNVEDGSVYEGASILFSRCGEVMDGDAPVCYVTDRYGSGKWWAVKVLRQATKFMITRRGLVVEPPLESLAASATMTTAMSSSPLFSPSIGICARKKNADERISRVSIFQGHKWISHYPRNHAEGRGAERGDDSKLQGLSRQTFWSLCLRYIHRSQTSSSWIQFKHNAGNSNEESRCCT